LFSRKRLFALLKLIHLDFLSVKCAFGLFISIDGRIACTGDISIEEIKANLSSFRRQEHLDFLTAELMIRGLSGPGKKIFRRAH
jgi:hypothetical protein